MVKKKINLLGEAKSLAHPLLSPVLVTVLLEMECPHCGALMNLADPSRSLRALWMVDLICKDRWEDVEGQEVLCHHCEREVRISECTL